MFVFLQPQGMLVNPFGQKANAPVYIHVCMYTYHLYLGCFNDLILYSLGAALFAL